MSPAVHLAHARLSELLDELLQHDGYGDLCVQVRILKRGQKEVLIQCGKHYRYVVDVTQTSEPPTQPA